MKSLSRLLEENRRILQISFVLQICLLMVRFIVAISDFLSIDLPIVLHRGLCTAQQMVYIPQENIAYLPAIRFRAG
jgi:hypothetical protein